jgi:hypothetical protein
MMEATSLTLLTTPSSRWVDIEVVVSPPRGDNVEVRSTHVYQDRPARVLGCTWSDLDGLNTEYGHGLSVVHDTKDHYVWGLDISQMAEFQVICQIQLGRALLSGRSNWRALARESILKELRAELFGPRQPRVYDPQVVALLGTSPAAAELERAVHAFCFEIAAPRLEAAFKAAPALLQLQRSVRDTPEVARHFLKQIHWTDEAAQLMRLRDNLDIRLVHRAYVNDTAAEISRSIYLNWMRYCRSNLTVSAEFIQYRPLSRGVPL